MPLQSWCTSNILRFSWDCPFKDYLSVEAALNILEEAGLEDSLPAHRLSTYRTVEKLTLEARVEVVIIWLNWSPAGEGDAGKGVTLRAGQS